MTEQELPGHGAIERPDHLKIKDHLAAGAALPFDWSQIKEDSEGNKSGLFGITDQDQGSGGTCTVQTTRYGFKYAAELDLSVEDIYSRVHLPGGGAYLNAPLDNVRKNGIAPQSKYPDPFPQTEQNMSEVIQVQIGDRIKTFLVTYTFYNPDIDSAARAITENDYIHLGIRGSFVHGWDKSWVDPIFVQNDWQHALFAGKESIVMRYGQKAIKARSSWCSHRDNTGELVFCHYLTSNYFTSGGVFEIIGVKVKELNSVLKVTTDSKTIFLEGEKGKLGLADSQSGELLASLTADQPVQTDPNVPQVGIIENGFTIHK